ncbi:type IV protein arginine methyltransferase [Malassezia psittaci]|uniref:Type IV protein arginine methyltransferase n=1 Tax=Malassezia psittaci TaxID=1821823 RepID=A0AAF0FDJ9_9BASI|nr:type IV protein arginine methyltransferase [Malassezia psittaci]
MEDEAWPATRTERNQELLHAAAAGNVKECERLLQSQEDYNGDWDGSADAWYADEELGWDAMHYAADAGSDAVVKLLLQSGGLWNAVDKLGFTAGDIAWSRNATTSYMALLEEGVRQSFLATLLERKIHGTPEIEAQETDYVQHNPSTEGASLTLVPGTRNEASASNEAYLGSRLTFEKDERGQWRCLDKDRNMVMAEWEDEIMQASARALCEGQQEGFSVLNVGFGLGIIDEAIQAYRPERHVIIEPHPDVLAFMKNQGWDKRPGVEIFEGTWEEFMRPKDDPEGEIAMKLGVFDAIYFDTYSQDYQDLRSFFDCLPNVLAGPDSRFSFFHGLAATNRFLYEVYTRVCELDLREIGLVTEWQTLSPRITEEDWNGVKRKYWSLAEYNLPLAHQQFWGSLFVVLFGTGVECEVRLHYSDNQMMGAFGNFLQCRIAWAAGIALGCWTAGGISGAHLNPAVTIAMHVHRQFPQRKVVPYILAQFAGCFTAAMIVYYVYHDSIAAYEKGVMRTVIGRHATAGMFVTFPSALISLSTAFATEMVGTATLLFLVAAVGDQGNWGLSRGTLPIGLFFIVLAIGCALGYNTGYALNPARDLGPRLALTFLGYGSELWTHNTMYWFGGPFLSPILGGILGVGFYDAFLYTGDDSLLTGVYVFDH